MSGPLLALTGAGLVGSADFFAGSATRRLPVAVVAVTGQLAGVAVLPVAIVVTRSWTAPGGSLLWAVGAGILSSASLSAFYVALARGPMGLVAPVVSAAVAVPLLVGLAAGDRPGRLAVTVLQGGGLVLRPRRSGPGAEPCR